MHYRRSPVHIGYFELELQLKHGGMFVLLSISVSLSSDILMSKATKINGTALVSFGYFKSDR